MIGKLTGKIDSIFEDKLILDVGGVGYNVYASSKTLNLLQAKKGQIISILIETIVKEEQFHLYGFNDEIEKIWFNELCKVSGVGSKMGLKILGTLSIEDIIFALNSGEKTSFTRVSGVGPKLALRIVSELKDSAKKIAGADFNISASKNSKEESGSDNNKIIADAISALENLGYSRGKIHPIIQKEVIENEQITLETLITNSLRKITN
jgi:holliday junction DNA helicase RuvA